MIEENIGFEKDNNNEEGDSPFERMLKNQFEFHGGFIIPTSSCCGAPIETTKGGVALRVCSRCRRLIFPTLYKGVETSYGL